MKNTRLIYFFRGIPFSGKTTEANRLLKNAQKTIIVSRDNFRRALYNKEVCSPSEEKFISKLIEDTIVRAIGKGMNIILDNQHISRKWFKFYLEIFRKAKQNLNNEVYFNFSLIDLSNVSLSSCLDRMAVSDKNIAPSYLEKQYKKLQKEGEGWYYDFNKMVNEINDYRYSLQIKYDISKPKSVIFDIDGTLALMNGRLPYEANKASKDLPIQPALVLLNDFKRRNYQIILCTGREKTSEDVTLNWLYENDIEFDELYMRAEGDNRSDKIVKFEMLKEIELNYKVYFVVDDRESVTEMWRDNNITTLQVNWGKF